MWSPDRLIVKLISNIALGMRENYCWLKGIDVSREGKESVACLLFADMQMFLIYQWCSCRKRLASNQLDIHLFYKTTGKVFLPKRKLLLSKRKVYDKVWCKKSCRADQVFLLKRRPDMTFALTIVKKVVATFQNPAIHRIISESNSTLCTVRNEQLSASNFLCSSFDILHASQAGKKISEPTGLVKGCAIFGCLWGQHPCSIWSVVGAGVYAAGAVCGWLADWAAYVPVFQHCGDGNEPSWVWVKKHK